MNIDVTKKKLEGVHIFHAGLALKVHRVRLDTVKERRGQFGRGLDPGCPKVLGHDCGCSAVVRTYVREGAPGPGVRVVVNNNIKVDVLKTLMVTRLGVKYGIPCKLARIDLFYWNQVDLKQSDHGQVVGSRDRVHTGNGCGRDLSPQKAFQRHGAPHGIRVRVDQDKKTVFMRKKAEETPQFFRSGSGHLSKTNLSCSL